MAFGAGGLVVVLGWRDRGGLDALAARGVAEPPHDPDSAPAWSGEEARED